MWAGRLYQGTLDLIYPPRCPFCERIERGVCGSCRRHLPYVGDCFCLKCGKALGDPLREYCSDCMATARYFDAGRGLFVHTGAVQDALYRFKFHDRRSYSRIFAGMLARRFSRQIASWHVCLIVPIPLHPSRRRERGYNQSALLAADLSEILAIPWSDDLLIRIKKTKRQKDLTPGDRQKNISGAFSIQSDKNVPECVLLLDDIYTTGATINEAARTLREAGAKRVVFLTISIGQED